MTNAKYMNKKILKMLIIHLIPLTPRPLDPSNPALQQIWTRTKTKTSQTGNPL